MKHFFYLLAFSLLLFSCSDNEKEEKTSTDNENLIETINGVYYEYYPGKKQVKITGSVDEKGRRHERWELYSPTGKQLGFTMYVHGKRHGHSYSSYPDGSPLYHGEYWEDTLIGVWKTYASDGKITTKDYGLPEGY